VCSLPGKKNKKPENLKLNRCFKNKLMITKLPYMDRIKNQKRKDG